MKNNNKYNLMTSFQYEINSIIPRKNYNFKFTANKKVNNNPLNDIKNNIYFNKRSDNRKNYVYTNNYDAKEGINYNIDKEDIYLSNKENSFSNNYNDFNVYNEQYYKTNRVMNDFKNTLKQTQIIRNQLMEKSYDIEKRLYYQKRYNNNNYNYINNIKNRKEISLDSSEDEDFDFNEYLREYYINNNRNCITEKNQNSFNYYLNNQKLLNSFENEIEKIKYLNDKLCDSNSHLLNDNNLLEAEIIRYKFKNNLIQNIPSNVFYTYLTKFINNVKSSIKQSLEKNMKLSEDILNLQKDLALNFYRNIKKINVYENLSNKIKKEKNKKLEIQKYNIENNKRYNKLNDEKNILNKELEKLKILLSNLKSKEKSLYLKHESNRKSKQDSEELILKLYKTINSLKKEEQINQNYIKEDKRLESNDESIILDQQLSSIINSIIKDKNMIEEVNLKLKNEIREIDNKNESSKDIINLKELKTELNKLKTNNITIINNIKEKEEQIKNLKKIIEQITNKEISDENLNQIFNDLVKSEPDEIIIKNKIEEDKIEEDIKKATKINKEKNDEIKYIQNYYDNILYKKDQDILLLEKQYLRKGYSLENIDKNGNDNNNYDDNTNQVLGTKNFSKDKNIDYINNNNTVKDINDIINKNLNVEEDGIKNNDDNNDNDMENELENNDYNEFNYYENNEEDYQNNNNENDNDEEDNEEEYYYQDQEQEQDLDEYDEDINQK